MLLRRVAKRRLSSTATFNLPFTINQKPALVAFKHWMESQQAFGRVHSVELRAEYVPFYVFAGRLNVTFTGLIGCESARHDGEVQWFERRGISFEISGASLGRAACVNAGLGPCVDHINDCLYTSLSASEIERHATWRPENTFPGIDAFKISPAAGYEEFFSRLSLVAEAQARRQLSRQHARSLVYTRRGSGSGSGGREVAGDAELRPDSISLSRHAGVEDVRWSVGELKLHEKVEDVRWSLSDGRWVGLAIQSQE
jgi:hypothetical protein